MAIYLNKKHFSSVSQLLEYGFSSYYFVETYKDVDCTVRENSPARRSFYDLVEICQTYFPTVSKEEVAYYLLNFKGISCFLCLNINKIVFLNEERKIGKIFDSRMGYKLDSSTVDSTGLSFDMIQQMADSFKNKNNE